MASPCNTPTLSLLLSLSSLLPLLTLATPNPTQCRTSCGPIPIAYPFGIDDGCGSPYYRRLLLCSSSGLLELRTPSGRYPVRNISYSDPHLLVTDPSMWTCRDGDAFRPARPFSLDTGTRLRVSPQNDYLFFNCSEDGVIMAAKPAFCERYPERCDSACDTSSYLCRHLPGGCAAAVRCCAYYPKGSASVGMMLRHCATYTSVYWRNLGVTPVFDQVPEYGVRVDYEVPVTARCLRCEDAAEGGGRCGFDTATEEFLCLCGKRNVTTYCKDGNSGHHSAAMVAGTVSGVSIAGAFVGFGVWYVRKVRAKAPVTHGVQTNDNRLI